MFIKRFRELNTPRIQKIVYLVCAFLTSLVGFLLLFIPFSLSKTGNSISPIALFSFLGDDGGFSDPAFISLTLLVLWCIYIAFVGIGMLKLVSHYGTESVRNYMRMTKSLCVLNTVVTGIYFVGGIIFNLVNTMILGGRTSTVNNVAPFIIVLFIDLCLALYIGLTFTETLKEEIPEKELKVKKLMRTRVEFFIYTTCLIACTVFCALTKIISVEFDKNGSDFANMDFSITGIDLLKNPKILQSSGQALAFLLLLVLTVTAALYLTAFISFLSKSRSFFYLSIATVLTCVVGCFVIGMYSKYYEMLRDANSEMIVEWLGNKISADDPLYKLLDLDAFIESQTETYIVTSTSYTLFLISLIPAAVILARRPYSNGLMLERELYAPISALTAKVDMAEISVSGVDNTPSNSAAPILPPQAVTASETVAFDDVSDVKNTDPCPAFTEIDNMTDEDDKIMLQKRSAVFEDPSLPKLVQFIVRYARNSRQHLSYTEEDIATFIAGLGATKLTILQGMSGTGKTSLPKIFAEALFSNCNIVEVESSWRDKNELLGYYNEFSKIYTPKKFTQALYHAYLNPETLTFIVLDEMNLSRIEYYFSDFLSLMENEPDKREIKLLNNGLFKTINGNRIPFMGLTRGHTIKIPHNVWFIGTANRDESTFEISDKVYDRAHTMNFNKRAQKVTNYGEALNPLFLSADVFNSLLENAKKTVEFNIDEYPLVAKVEKLLAPYHISFGNRIAMQIESFVSIYCACFAFNEDTVRDAVERILLSKVVYKLELKSVDNKDELAAAFEELGLHRCSEFISKLDEE